MSNKKNRESRRVTEWDEVSELTETQSFIKAKIEEHYDQRHPKLQDSGEAGLINSCVPKICPFCGCKKNQEIWNDRKQRPALPMQLWKDIPSNDRYDFR